ncbi:hypothetical protein COEREDRAFT_81986 [Coemansia reversa NRRL 1564]|uniref:Pre-mRNA splicing factor component Cdc5p/Cef1 C-terminal domain-containing protein n=1 Tax=Coemansia reversa (strain ATCC 12441 / NRRL 1564) TaxID=763665 RepID=A0A2G5B8S8_COERN|nr:hypothetical protein COEREDRAFT_81986 [Coemansia reversa NRRL 1564]|eukprot:PIA15433.1 hypothetical protein COEREDRAFT_81986 [Coemansia reversa NRRL 1564]
MATIAKLGQQSALARELVGADDNSGSANGLLGDYSETPSLVPARTPRVPMQSDRIMNEALAQRAMAAQSTPLLGSDQTTRPEQHDRGTGFHGALPQGRDMPTPNPFALSVAMGRGGGPGMTALRDELGLNTPALGEGATPRERKLANRGLREQLAHKLAALPQPKNEFEIVVPEHNADQSEESLTADAVAALHIGQTAVGSAAIVEDRADIERRIEQERKNAAELELSRRSQSVKRNLPRPDMLLENVLATTSDSNVPVSVLDMISNEMRTLIMHDAYKHPVPDTLPLRPSRPINSTLESIADNMLEKARSMVEEEMSSMLQEMRDAYDELSGPAGENLWHSAEHSEIWLPQSQRYVSTEDITKDDWIQKHRLDLERRRELMAEQASRATKVERKLGVALGGYQARSKALCEKIQTAYKKFEQTKLDTKAFADLHTSEKAIIPARIEKAQSELNKVEARETQLQEEYQTLLERRDKLAAELVSLPTSA